MKNAGDEGKETGPDASLLARTEEVIAAVREDRIEEADALYRQLCEHDPRALEMPVFPVLILIQRGQTLDALRFINDLPPGRCPELRALCLQVLGDPTWHGEATALIDSPNPTVRLAMRQLLGMQDVATDVSLADPA